MNKKILYIINHMDWFWSHRLPLAEGAKQAGYDVSVACSGATTDKKLEAHGFASTELRTTNILSTILALRKILQTQKPDLVHAITLKYAFITGLAALGLHVKIVHTIAGLGYLFSGEGLKPKILRLFVSPFLKLALHNAQLIFQNPDDMELLIQRGLAQKNQCHLIRGSGVDVQQFFATPLPEDDPPLIIMPTRLVHEKGVAVFIETAKILQTRGVEAQFKIAGGISTTNPNAITEEDMQKMLEDSPVEWLGKVSDMPALFAGCNLVVYPSYYREGIPKVLLEAAASGRAIITTDHPGCREAVDGGVNGALVPIKDPHATAGAVEKILQDLEMLKKMSRASRKKAEDEFDVKLIVQQTLKTYSAE